MTSLTISTKSVSSWARRCGTTTYWELSASPGSPTARKLKLPPRSVRSTTKSVSTPAARCAATQRMRSSLRSRREAPARPARRSALEALEPLLELAHPRPGALELALEPDSASRVGIRLRLRRRLRLRLRLRGGLRLPGGLGRGRRPPARPRRGRNRGQQRPEPGLLDVLGQRPGNEPLRGLLVDRRRAEGLRDAHDDRRRDRAALREHLARRLGQVLDEIAVRPRRVP